MLAGFLLTFTTLPAVDATPDLASARRLLAAGRIEDSERLVRHSLQTVGNGNNAAVHTTLGDILFRRGSFDEAALSYRAALAGDPARARAWWGLGRIEQAQFRRTSARAFMARAFGLDPRDPEIVFSYAAFMPDPASRATLLQNVVQLTRHSDLLRAEESMGQIEIDRRLFGLSQARLESPYQTYTIKLSAFQPVSSRSDGLLVPVRINGGKPLRLLLDTGARGITISAEKARQLQLEAVSESRIGGLGGGVNAVIALSALAKTISIGDLRLGNCMVEVTSEALTGGADGVIGMNLFEAFEIRLDAPARVLQLTPFTEGLPALGNAGGTMGPWGDYDRKPATADAPATPAYGFRHFLLVRTIVNRREGLFLLDTGSALTLLAREFAPPALWTLSAPSLHGAGGQVSDAVRLSPVTLKIAGKSYVESEPLALDLSSFSQREGVRISGILGFSALSKAPLSINYRDGLVDLGSSRMVPLPDGHGSVRH